MATAGDGPNRSAFLRDLFGRSPDIKPEEATEAWRKAGHEGEISGSLFYNVKRALGEKAGGGVAASRRAGPKAAAKRPKGKRVTQPAGETRPGAGSGAATGATPRRSGAGERERALDRVEDGLDDLIGELKQLGGMEDALEALRKARRVVVRSHEG